MKDYFMNKMEIVTKENLIEVFDFLDSMTMRYRIDGGFPRLHLRSRPWSWPAIKAVFVVLLGGYYCRNFVFDFL